MGGYGLFMAHLEDEANKNMEQQLDAESYDTSTLITIKIPLTKLSYYTNSADYERQNGEVEINGVKYNYVKKRIYNDTLEMVCIFNAEATKLRTARNDFFKLCNELQNAAKSKKAPAGNTLKFFSPGNCRERKTADQLCFINNCTGLARPFVMRPFYYVTVIERPPEI